MVKMEYFCGSLGTRNRAVWVSSPFAAAASAVLLAFLSSAIASAQVTEDDTFYDCVVDPSLVLNLGSSVAGLIDEIVVERGQTVKAGDVVAQLRSEAEQARLAQARTRAESDAQIQAQKAALDLANARSSRIEQLREKAVATEAQREEVEAELSTAQMNLRLAEVQRDLDRLAFEEAKVMLDLRTIRSPVNGVVTERNKGPGEYVFQETHILTVAQVDPLYVRALLPVSAYPFTPQGSTVQVHLDLPTRRVVTARIMVVDKVLNASAGTFGIRAEIANPDGFIPAGQTCKLTMNQS